MIHCRVVTPNGMAKELDTSILNIVSVEGQRGILPHHMPLVTALMISKMTTVEEGVRNEYAIAGGLLVFENDQATILTDSIESKDEIDLNRAEAAKRRAEDRIMKTDGNFDMRRAEIALKKAINRISIKG